MAANGHHHGGRSLLVLYKIANSESDAGDPLYNCFSMPYGAGPTLSAVKQHCAAAHSLSHLGPEGYHWRVLVEEKAGSSGEKSFSWWDIQDGNAKLPVKEATQYELRKLLFPSKPSSSSSSLDATKAAKGAFKMMGKMASAVAGDDVGESHGPPVSVLMFKLLDLVKIHDDFSKKHGGSHPPPPVHNRPRASAPAPRPAQPRAQQPARPQQTQHRAPARAQTAPHTRTPAPAPQQEASLMDFGAPTPAPARANPKVLHHAKSSPPAINPNESRAERLKREMAKKKQNMNRVWDDVDQRWVEVEKKPANHAAAARPKQKEVGISIDESAAIGKSASVQNAVAKRFQDMKDSQEKALREVREREAKKKREEEEEDVVRKQLEPKIKAWSEEHGKKKQLRALLGTLHTVLWPGAKWKPLSIGDILDDSKVKRAFHKATLVVHPDKTGHLPADQRFLAKRIFDALCQAKTDFDNGAN